MTDKPQALLSSLCFIIIFGSFFFPIRQITTSCAFSVPLRESSGSMWKLICPETWHHGRCRLHTNPSVMVKTCSVAKVVLYKDSPSHWDAFLALAWFSSILQGLFCACTEIQPPTLLSLGAHMLTCAALMLSWHQKLPDGRCKEMQN